MRTWGSFLVFNPTTLELARKAREVVILCAAASLTDDLDKALDFYAESLTLAFGPDWRHRIGPGYPTYLADRLQQGY